MASVNPLPDGLRSLSDLRHTLSQVSTSGGGSKRVSEVLSLVNDVLVLELHDAHRICWQAVIGDNDLAHP